MPIVRRDSLPVTLEILECLRYKLVLADQVVQQVNIQQVVVQRVIVQQVVVQQSIIQQVVVQRVIVQQVIMQQVVVQQGTMHRALNPGALVPTQNSGCATPNLDPTLLMKTLMPN
jgi:hypothetical protein